MRHSMTGFASFQGQGQGLSWTWEMRGVNGKGLDLRLRLPDWIEGLEAAVRTLTVKALQRGNVQISLKVSSNGEEGALRLDKAQLEHVLAAMTQIETRALETGLSLAPSTAADIVSLRGVLTAEAEEADQALLKASILKDFEAALASFIEMRATEGAALEDILARQVGEIETLVAQAETLAADRAPQQAERLRTQLARILDTAENLDEARLAQELAIIAVKSDVTEEIDRLRAHVSAARDLLHAKGAVGRKLDFLMQEFNREANTLCSKSGDPDLTQVGLTLKTVIDQMREQVQNVE
ncbi:MAG: YicC family protein [Pelagimonas sp.]|nr:YicC family protein [Pelagimonas sp.]